MRNRHPAVQGPKPQRPRAFSSDVGKWLNACDDWTAQWLVNYASRFSISVFRDPFREALRRQFGFVGLQMVEACISCSSIDQPGEFEERTSRVRRMARRNGIRIHRVGKRSAPELETMVRDLAPVLLRLGVPLGSGENSLLVLALRDIGRALGVDGDPRTVLRRLRRQHTLRSADADTLVVGAMIRAMKQD